VVDVDRLLETLDRHQVEFLVVGGFSAIAHGATRPTVAFDVLAEIPAGDGRRVRYEELLERASTAPIGRHTVMVAGLDDVIASKEWANRPKDHDALPELRQLRERR
jgi:hypothetical protein